MDDRKARAAILASGDKALIDRLHLLEAGAGRTDAPSRAYGTSPAAGVSALGTGLAAAGGALAGAAAGSWIGTALAGTVLSAEMQAAFAAVAEDLGYPAEAIDAALPGSFPADAAGGDLLGDLGLDDLDIFDI